MISHSGLSLLVVGFTKKQIHRVSATSNFTFEKANRDPVSVSITVSVTVKVPWDFTVNPIADWLISEQSQRSTSTTVYSLSHSTDSILLDS